MTRWRRGTAVCALAVVACLGPLVSGCSSDEPVPARVEVTLYHCGLEPLSFAGTVWEAAEPEVDSTNVPPEWRGRGTLTQVSPAELRYRDDSGIEVTFVPDLEVPPVGCA